MYEPFGVHNNTCEGTNTQIRSYHIGGEKKFVHSFKTTHEFVVVLSVQRHVFVMLPNHRFCPIMNRSRVRVDSEIVSRNKYNMITDHTLLGTLTCRVKSLYKAKYFEVVD